MFLSFQIWFFCFWELCPSCWFVSKSREMKRKVMWPKRPKRPQTSRVWWQVWAGRGGGGGAERTALFFAPALWWPCTPVSLLFTLVSSILSHWVWGGACGNPTVTKGRSSPRQASAADHSPLDLGSVVKLPLKNSIALATIYLHRHKRKLCRLRCFSTKVCLGDIPYKGCRKWMLMGKGLLWTHNSLQRLQQQTRTAAFFKKKYITACRSNLSSICSSHFFWYFHIT